MFRSINEVRGWKKNYISPEILERLVKAGEVIHESLASLPETVSSGYHDQFLQLLDTIEKAKNSS